ncbi:E3 ubiquitin ligase BIG BROTHER [Apostasia shenzhenica]|uniref:RING-type E3 ubiquitin transferase n=1 Tax=Apostasia shenzhenica TaxID=1088818 RepID=A0A2I0B2M8_9ASPA|nr:E3 ubiquitin ligase BIG BROTHER [Apostasia shenzhenica]
MASVHGPSSSPDLRGIRRLLRLRKPATSSADQDPLISSSSPPLPPPSGEKKKSVAAIAFRGLGCASSAASQAYAPAAAAAAVRSSADWHGKRTRRRRAKHKKKDRLGQPSAVAAADVWCAPGIALVAGDDSVDCVVSHREMVERGGRHDAERALRERLYSGRRGGSQEQVYSTADSLSSLQATLFGSDLMPSGHYYHHMRGYYARPPVELEEWLSANLLRYIKQIMLFQHRLLLRGDAYDQHRDWRLDVDNMTYEELLELGDKIGYVNTGLREEEIALSIRKVKHSILDLRFSTEMERKCSVCQEEYEMDDEVGKLGCGHSYHIYCIKKWLLQKNACPVCKTAVTKN